MTYYTNRRKVLKKGGAALLALSAAQSFLSDASASGNKDSSNHPSFQAPGFFRFSLGRFRITMLSDGGLLLPNTSFGANIPEAQVKAFLKSNYSHSSGYFAHTNACLIDTGEKIILVDTGSGQNFQKTTGKIDVNLKAAGFSTDDIDIVVLTHAHPDHAWGVIDTATGKPKFQKAEYFINAVEWDYWTQEDIESKIPDSFRKFAVITKNTLIPIASKTNRIKAGQDIIAGVTSLDTSGHTPGHISLAVTSEKEVMYIAGDTVHHPFVSFEQPDWHFSYDMDPGKAVIARRSLMDRASSEGALFTGFHLPFPGVGRVAMNQKSYRWIPENWKWEI